MPARLLVACPRMNTGENANVKNRSHDGKKVQCLSRKAKLSTKAELCFDVATSVLVKKGTPAKAQLIFLIMRNLRASNFPGLSRHPVAKGLRNH